MSFNIPGYFLDQKTKKLFKITPHGPFSLKELQKRLKREEEEAAAAVAATSTSGGLNTSNSGSKIRPPSNIIQFLRQRATHLVNTDHSGLPFLMTQLKSRTTLQLEGPKHMYNNMLVALTSDPDYGEMIVSFRSGRLARFGYQVNPGFQLWKVGLKWTTPEISSDVLSLHFGSRSFTFNGQECRTVVGTSGGHLWRYSMPKLPSLSDDDLNQLDTTADHILATPRTSYLGFTESPLEYLFTKKKDLFWSSNVDDDHDHLVVGGDQAIYQCTSTFDLVTSRKVNSSVFATHLPYHEPNLCWTGSRNGLIQLIDFRQKQMHLLPKYKQSSSVTQVQTLNGFELLTMGMDGSVNIWDTRRPKQYHGSGSSYDKGRGHQQQEPIRKLKGHVNESSHHLGFDIDLENNLLMLAGSDGHLRIWSVFNSGSNEPVWCSEKFCSPIPAAKFMLNSQYPRIQDGWSSFSIHSCPPGVLLFGAENTESSSIQWLTAVK